MRAENNLAGRAMIRVPPPERPPRWSLADIPYDRIDLDKVRDDERLFELVAAASFVEITSATYTRNLVAFYSGDEEVVDWLEAGWEHEEVQHGEALRRYVECAWPHFDWQRAYDDFYDEYSRLCLVDNLAESRALEMVARCVVETGTASFYRMLSDAAPEPVLATLAQRISADEVDHYKHFFRYFRRYAASEQPSRAAVVRTLWRRMSEIDAEDAAIAFKHVCRVAYPASPFRADDYQRFRGAVRAMARRHYRCEMAVKMLLKPLQLSGVASRVAVPSATALTRLFLLH